MSGLLREWRLWPMLCLLGLLLGLLVALSSATENSTRFGASYSWLLFASALSLMLISVLIGLSLSRLVRRYRQREPGSRLTLRLVVMFVAIAVLPASVVYYFSVQFLQRGIESWFDVRIEVALEDALELSRVALDLRIREVLKQTERISLSLGEPDDDQTLRLEERLNAQLAVSDAAELTLFGRSGRILATAGSDPTVIVPDQPSEVVLLQAREGNAYVALEPTSKQGFHIRVAVRVLYTDPTVETPVLQALYLVPERLSGLADSVREAFDEYKELVYLRDPLKTGFIWSLSLVLLFGILSALWAALYSARQLVAPIRDLAEGTRAVTEGRFDQQLPLPGNDELGFLVHSFNLMTRKLSQARDQAQRSQQLIEQQRAFLEAVLSRLSNGVITLDRDGVLYTHNAAASQILGTDLALAGAEQPAHLRRFFEAIKPHLDDEASDWQQEITLFSQSGRQVLLCRGSALPDTVGLSSGRVLVFDDITTLVRAQRDAAWTEVARRLAHEIKNPLTPIQLAAERIRHKLLGQVEPDVARVLDRSTHTIVQQVSAMKDMVNAFNEYARPPKLKLTRLSLNELITDVLYMYKDHPDGIDIKLDLDPLDPQLEADRGRLRQLIHNLAQNAIEAQHGRSGGRVWVSTQFRPDDDGGRDPVGGSVELRFDDAGPGFPADGIGDVFEPYVTTKPKGTGLGLAIVKKIVDDHGGVIELAERDGGGASVRLRFPASCSSGQLPRTGT